MGSAARRAGRGSGCCSSWRGCAAIRRPQLAVRVLPYVRDLPADRPHARAQGGGVVDLRGGRGLRAAAAVRRRRGRAGPRRRGVRTPPPRARRPGQDGPRVPGRAGDLGAGRRSSSRRASGCCAPLADPASAVSSLLVCALALRGRRGRSRQPPHQPGHPARAADPHGVPDRRRAARAGRRGRREPGRGARPRRTPQRRRALARPGPGAGRRPHRRAGRRRLRPAAPRRPASRWSPASPRASPSRSSAAPRWPTSCTPRPPTSARPGAASSSRPRRARRSS